MASGGELNAHVIKRESGQYDLELVRRLRASGLRLTRIASLELCARLHTLDLSRNCLTTVEGLAGCAALTRLVLAHNRLTSLEGVDRARRLESLDARANELSDCAAVAAALRPCVALRTVDLQAPDGADANPCCAEEGYAAAVAAAVPRLETHDGRRCSLEAEAAAIRARLATDDMPPPPPPPVDWLAGVDASSASQATGAAADRARAARAQRDQGAARAADAARAVRDDVVRLRDAIRAETQRAVGLSTAASGP